MEESLITLFHQAEDYFFRSMSLECLDFDDNATAYFTGVNLGSDNPVYIRKNIESINDILNRCERFYSGKNVSWDVIVTTHSFDNLKFNFIGKSVAMYIGLNEKYKHIIPDDVTIYAVDDKLEEWMLPLGGAFETTAEVTQQYADVHKRALINNANFYHFTLYKAELPISSLTLTVQGTVARISDVGTLPEHQKKGYATQLMKYATNQAIDLGATYCFLEASESGIAVYKNLGFIPLFKNNTYSRR